MMCIPINEITIALAAILVLPFVLLFGFTLLGAVLAGWEALKGQVTTNN